MVNLEELKENESRRFYETPQMTIKRIDFSDILTTSGGDPANLLEGKDPTQQNGDEYGENPFPGIG